MYYRLNNIWLLYFKFYYTFNWSILSSYWKFIIIIFNIYLFYLNKFRKQVYIMIIVNYFWIWKLFYYYLTIKKNFKKLITTWNYKNWYFNE